MSKSSFDGAYVVFETSSKKDGAALIGADNLVGDRLEIHLEHGGKDDVAWLRNRFGDDIGFLGAEASRTVALAVARGCDVQARLASVWFTDRPEPGRYWGEVVIMAYPTRDGAAFEPLCNLIGDSLADGVRPSAGLSVGEATAVAEGEAPTVPSTRVPALKPQAGTACLKSHRSFNESMIEKARQRNVGCMICGWVFLLALVALAVFGIKSCAGL